VTCKRRIPERRNNRRRHPPLRRKVMLAQADVVEYVEEMRRALEGACEYRDGWDRLHRRLAPRPPERRVRIADLCRAYEEATGTWTGCD
jgi:hypothetical protein